MSAASSIPHSNLYQRYGSDSTGFAGARDVVRALIREVQERDQAMLFKRLKAMEPDGSSKPEPAAAVLSIVQRVKKERRA
ncbi:MAG TPA: hypothetical protein P5555_04300 [Candidatus Paceibacterota bacterium]|nr:hypothetical protein [Verrucomicrobiota bacterium]HOX02666.1 hypothetical protein [Verrucomicrobiota bacterium]HRZ44393.1 hypothetical protein [Candidatus Paceibacterota bacterium]HRZ55746.1 hypothetical protein [Candidatus Paceibacterota bacterium]